MKRFLLHLIGVAAVVAFMTLPASAADMKFGGMFWTKFYSDDNMKDGTDDLDDNLNGFYTRMRLYFTAVESENLRAVFRGEIDDIWGDGRIGSVSTDGGSDGRADGVGTANGTNPSANSGMELKNFYIEFNMPNTPLTFQVGALPIKVGSGLVFNDDSNGIVAIGKFDPVKVVLAYSRLNDNASDLSFANTAARLSPHPTTGTSGRADAGQRGERPLPPPRAGSPLSSRTYSTFSKAVSTGIRLQDWKTKPISSSRRRAAAVRERPPSARPATRTVPAEGASIPPIRFRSVVLPEPLGPMSA